MKVWIKYLLGIALGILAALILPFWGVRGSEFLSFTTELFVRFGRYLVVPLVFCTSVVSINRLRSSKNLLKTTIWTFSIIIISALILTIVGTASILLVKLPRIPITIDVATEITHIDVKGMVLSLFPYSAFDALREGSFLLVAFLFGSLIGWESASDQVTFKPVSTIADSFSKLFYYISVFFTEVMSVFIIVFVIYWTLTFRSVISTGIYTPMIIMFVCDFVIIAGIIYPLIIRYVCHDPRPYRVLYAGIAPMLLSFICGDTNLSLPLTMRHGKESLGIRRRCNGFVYPLFSMFSRGGSALVTTICFFLIWRSYSSLSIPFSDIMWVSLLSFGLSFLLGGFPSGGAFILLTILCEKYGKGFETSFLLLSPASLIICSFASLFDTVTVMFGSYIVAVKTKNIEHHKARNFI